jgi:hypothetical protein
VQVGYEQGLALPGSPLQKGDKLGIGKVMQHQIEANEVILLRRPRLQRIELLVANEWVAVVLAGVIEHQRAVIEPGELQLTGCQAGLPGEVMQGIATATAYIGYAKRIGMAGSFLADEAEKVAMAAQEAVYGGQFP